MRTWDEIQHDALAELAAEIDRGSRNICMSGPTGCGKGRMMAMRCEAAKLVAIYTHRKMLFDQLCKVLARQGLEFGMRASGQKPAKLKDIQLCMLQTESSRLADDTLHECEEFHVDEIHANSGPTVQEIVGRHQANGAIGIYWTATPLGIGHICDSLIQIATTSELRQCGALVPCYHFGPDEPDTKWIKNIKIDGGECGIPNAQRAIYAHRVFGRVLEHYRSLNPEQLPTVLFAPGVKESIWFAEQLSNAGVPAAHIDGMNVWIDGHEETTSTDLRDEIRERCESGDIKVVCNRFVMREGIDWPFLRHAIFATVFGSLTSYIQAGGRLLRAAPNKERAVIQDHGGNWWRHGSLNSDWKWELGDDDRLMAGVRARRLKEKKDREPICCPQCFSIRNGGAECPQCGYRHTTKSRIVVQKDGSLREMKGDIYRQPRRSEHTEKGEQEWIHYLRGIANSKKDTVKDMTVAQAEANWARRNNWKYPPLSYRYMPTSETDWFRAVREVFPELERSRHASTYQNG